MSTGGPDKITVGVEIRSGKVLAELAKLEQQVHQRVSGMMRRALERAGIEEGKFTAKLPNITYRNVAGQQTVDVFGRSVSVDMAKATREKANEIAQMNAVREANRKNMEKMERQNAAAESSRIEISNRIRERNAKNMEKMERQSERERERQIELGNKIREANAKNEAKDLRRQQVENERIILEGNRIREANAKAEDRILREQQRDVGRRWNQYVNNLSTRQRRRYDEMFMSPQEIGIARYNRRQEAQDRLDRIQQIRERRRSQQIMGLASGGIGLFGSAGFPLLNIAFASMSGGIYAGIAAASTAFGESARYILRLQDASMQAAESLKFLSKATKETNARFEATKAFYGGLLQVSRERMIRERMSSLQGGMGGALPLWMYLGNLRTNIQNTIFRPGNMRNPLISAIPQTMRDIVNLPNTLKESIDSMRRELGNYSAKFEKPEDMWRRIQQAAASPGDENRRLAMKQLETMESMRKMAEAISNMINRWTGGTFAPKPERTGIEGQVGDIIKKSFILNPWGAFYQ